MTERRSYDADVATLQEKVRQLESRCDKKDIKIDALMAFQNRAIGYAMASSALVSIGLQYITK